MEMSEEIFNYQVEMEVTADGEPLQMNEFVKKMFQGTIKGMISALHIPDNNQEITFEVTLKR
jgi:hypothetical protein